jgi:predicted ATPase
MKPPVLKTVRLENILSFGEAMELDLQPLNVLIGPNGSGKSNLIDAIELFRASAFDSFSKRDMRTLMSRNGGFQEWMYKGDQQKGASLECMVRTEHYSIKHSLGLSPSGGFFNIDSEEIKSSARRLFGRRGIAASFFTNKGEVGEIPEDVAKGQTSIVAIAQDSKRFPEFYELSRFYSSIRIFREWSLGRKGIVRQPQPADTLGDHLDEDFANLALFLNSKFQDPKLKRHFLENLKDIYDGVTDIHFSIVGGTVQLALVEGDHRIPATRLSDGTLRYLCLLAILMDPDPAPLVCIEEPELGLHPDILPGLAELLIEASSRTQLIVTTHSDILVGALSETLESVLVCEKYNGATQMRRLRKAEVEPWLDKYRLGELWIDGQLGGKRW